MKILKFVYLIFRYLTVREQKLRQRRKQAEELLAWKRRLDEEENSVYKIEKEIILWEEEKRKKRTKEKSDEKGIHLYVKYQNLYYNSGFTPHVPVFFGLTGIIF